MKPKLLPKLINNIVSGLHPQFPEEKIAILVILPI